MKSIFVVFVTLFFVAVVSAQAGEENSKPETVHDKCEKQPETCEAYAKNCCSAEKTNCAESCTSLIFASNDTKVKPLEDFVKYSNDYLIRSYQYLFLSAQFGTFSKDRPGFEKILHGLSDDAWGKGIEMIKESAKRGVSHSFKESNVNAKTVDGDVNEVEALAKAVQIEKELLEKAMDIHRHHSHATSVESKACNYDVGISHFLEEKIIEDKIDTVRNLVGHVNDLKSLFADNGALFPMSLHLFDQHLQK